MDMKSIKGKAKEKLSLLKSNFFFLVKTIPKITNQSSIEVSFRKENENKKSIVPNHASQESLRKWQSKSHLPPYTKTSQLQIYLVTFLLHKLIFIVKKINYQK